MKSTDYYNTFIEVAEDCPVNRAEVPVQKGEKKSAILLQFEMIAHHPYVYIPQTMYCLLSMLREMV